MLGRTSSRTRELSRAVTGRWPATRRWPAGKRASVTHPETGGAELEGAATAESSPLGDGPVGDILRLIRARSSGDRGDGHRLGLAVEGGGMRGIVSGGMLLALRDLGLIDVFDRFYGTSSGSVNLAYLFGGSDWDAMSIYYDHLTAGFVRRRPWNVARPLLDMRYAFDEVIARTIPVRWEAVREAGRPVNAVLTNVDRVRVDIKDLREMGGDGVAYLKAASWLPVLAGPPPVVAGTRYLDGGVLCPDPVYAAMADGCTHVLLLNTSPQGVWSAAPRSRPMLRPILNRWQPGLGEAYVRSRETWDADRAFVRFGGDVAMGDCTVLRVAAPAGSHRVERLTMRRDLLLDGARAGYRSICETFGGSARPYFSLVLR